MTRAAESNDADAHTPSFHQTANGHRKKIDNHRQAIAPDRVWSLEPGALEGSPTVSFKDHKGKSPAPTGSSPTPTPALLLASPLR